MLSDDPATIATCLGPLDVFTRPTIRGGKSECITRGSLSSLIFHRSFMFLTLSVVRIFSSFCHAVRCGLPPSLSQSAPQARTPPSINSLTIRSLLMCGPYRHGDLLERWLDRKSTRLSSSHGCISYAV